MKIPYQYPRLLKSFSPGRHTMSLGQSIMTTYLLLIEIEHALANWFAVDYRKKEARNRVIRSTYESSL
jgi:hypothetical protein